MKFCVVSKNYVCFKEMFGKVLQVFCLMLVLTFSFFAQSSDQNLPTPISSNQLIGEIKARDIGDSRLTIYYFVFNGNRGDIFINTVTSNLNGDIDIFELEGLKPKTKITLYADSSESETGRVIYLRKPEKLILRIQGRSPNDDPATYQIKFAGSFEPIQAVAGNVESDLPTVVASRNAKVKVNSVGTIIEETPKPTPKIKVVIVEDKNDVEEKVAENIEKRTNTDSDTNKNEDDSKGTYFDPIDKKPVEKNEATADSTSIPRKFDPTIKVDDFLKGANKDKNPRLVIIDPYKAAEKKAEAKIDVDETKESETTELTVELKDKPQNTSAVVTIERVEEIEEKVDEKVGETANPLAKIFLKVELKNGDNFERSMVEVLSMNVIKGVLTIVTNDGKIQEYSILDVVKMTIE